MERISRGSFFLSRPNPPYGSQAWEDDTSAGLPQTVLPRASSSPPGDELCGSEDIPASKSGLSPPEGSDDTHSPNWGNVRSWTGILAPGLSEQNVLDALAKRHVFSTLDRNCKLTFQVNGATMGDSIQEPVQEVKVKVLVDDADTGATTAMIELCKDGKVAQVYELNKQATCWLAGCSPPAGKHYYFVKAAQADGNLLWSAPIWVTTAGIHSAKRLFLEN